MGVGGEGLLFIIILFVLFFLVLSLVIRGAIDNSNVVKKMDVLIDEIRTLRKEVKENKHIIDKRL